MLEDHNKFNFWFLCLHGSTHSYKEQCPPIINSDFDTILCFEVHLARAITRRRTLIVHQETNDDTSNVVRTTSLIRFFHQPLCCFFCILNWFNHSNSFLKKSRKKFELELDKTLGQGLDYQFYNSSIRNDSLVRFLEPVYFRYFLFPFHG